MPKQGEGEIRATGAHQLEELGCFLPSEAKPIAITWNQHPESSELAEPIDESRRNPFRAFSVLPQELLQRVMKGCELRTLLARFREWVERLEGKVAARDRTQETELLAAVGALVST